MFQNPTPGSRPVAILLSTADWEAMEETLEILEDDALLAALRESEDDVRSGRLTSLAEVRRDRRAAGRKKQRRVRATIERCARSTAS